MSWMSQRKTENKTTRIPGHTGENFFKFVSLCPGTLVVSPERWLKGVWGARRRLNCTLDLPTGLRQVLQQLTATVRLAQLLEGFLFNLADALTGQTEFLACFFQRVAVAIA